MEHFYWKGWFGGTPILGNLHIDQTWSNTEWIKQGPVSLVSRALCLLLCTEPKISFKRWKVHRAAAHWQRVVVSLWLGFAESAQLPLAWSYPHPVARHKSLLSRGPAKGWKSDDQWRHRWATFARCKWLRAPLAEAEPGMHDPIDVLARQSCDVQWTSKLDLRCIPNIKGPSNPQTSNLYRNLWNQRTGALGDRSMEFQLDGCGSKSALLLGLKFWSIPNLPSGVKLGLGNPRTKWICTLW